VVKDVAKPSDERDPSVQSDPLQQLTSLQKSGASQSQAPKQAETTASKAVTATATGATTQQDADTGRLTSEEGSMQGQPGGQTSGSVDDSAVDSTDTQMTDNPVNPPKTPENNQWRRTGVVPPSSSQPEQLEPAPKNQSKRSRKTPPSPATPTPATRSKKLKTTQPPQGNPAPATGPKKSKANQPPRGKPASAAGPKKSKANQPVPQELRYPLRNRSTRKLPDPVEATTDSGGEQSSSESEADGESGSGYSARPKLIVKLRIGPGGNPALDSGSDQSTSGSDGDQLPPGSDDDDDSGSEYRGDQSPPGSDGDGDSGSAPGNGNPSGSPSDGPRSPKRAPVGIDARQRKRLQDAISKGASNNALAEVQQLLASCPISFIPGDATYDLDAADVLSLPYFTGCEHDSWFTGNIIYALSRIEGEYVHDAYAELELNPWFSGTNMEDLSTYIEDAEEGIPNLYVWPFAKWKPQHNRCVAVINPSGVHWMAVEVSFADDSPVIRCFNSMPTYDEEDDSYLKVVQGIPKLLRFASFRPDWPMGQFSLEDINVEHVKCPRQARHSGDCGPLAFLCLARRLHDLPAFPDQIKLDTNKMRAAFGQWVRERCIHALWSRCHDASFDTLFTELVDIDGFAAIESVDISARQAGLTGSDDVAALPARLTMDSLDQLAYTDSRSADKPGSSEIYNLEFGEKRQGTLFVVVVFRWSGSPPWGRWGMKTRQQCIDRLIGMARDRLRSYLHQSGNTDAELHVTIVTGCKIPTKTTPLVDIHTTKGAKLDSDHNSNITVRCPFCKYSHTSRDRPNNSVVMRTVVAAHIAGTHMLKNRVSSDDDRCYISGCEWKLDVNHGKNSMQTKYVREKNKLDHAGRVHLDSWLAAKGKTLDYTCDCRDPNCPGTTSDTKTIDAHLGETFVPGTCPFEGCAKSLSTASVFQHHVRYQHLADPLPEDWYRCVYDQFSRDCAINNFGLLPRARRQRLVKSCQLSHGQSAHCPWYPDECKNGRLMDMKKLEKHCQLLHHDNFWPFTHHGEEQCGLVVQTQDRLDKHYLESHILPGGPARFTALIDDALKRACRAAIEFGDDNPLPVLLSAGTDGFTCSASQFSKWMEAKKFEFTLAIIEQKTMLDTTYLSRDSEYHLGQYNSLTLTEAIDNPDEASDKYKDLIRVW
jgi:hypothetical protein